MQRGFAQTLNATAPLTVNGQSGVNVSGPAVLAVDASALPSSFGNQSANSVFAGPASGAAATPTFRSLVTDDLPDALAGTSLTITATSQSTRAAVISESTPFASYVQTKCGGWRFTVGSADLTVTHLGYRANQLNSGTRSVGIYNMSGTLLASASVASTDSTDGGFKYKALVGSITLLANTDYLIAAVVPTTDNFLINTTSNPFNSQITYVSSYQDTSGSLIFPTTPFTNVSGNYQFGASFKFTSVRDFLDVDNTGVSIYQALAVDGTITATGAITASNLSGTNTGDQTITLTGDVTGSGTGSFAATIGANKVTNAKIRQSAALSVIGNSLNAQADVADISASATGQILRCAGTSIGFGAIDLTSANAVNNLTNTQILFGGASGQVSQNANFTVNSAAGTAYIANGLSIGVTTNNFLIDAQKSGSEGQAVVTTYGAGTRFIARRAQGTQASPSATMSGNTLCALEGWGYGTSFAQASGRILISAAEDFNAGALGANLTVSLVKAGTTTLTTRFQLNGSDGAATFLFDANNTGLVLNQVTPSKQANLSFQDNGTEKFLIGKQTDNSLFMYDTANARDFVRVSTAGNLLLQPLGGNIGMGAGATTPVSLLSLASATPRITLFDTDNPLSGTNPSWSIRAQDDGTFRLQSSADNSTFTNRQVTNTTGTYFGNGTPINAIDNPGGYAGGSYAGANVAPTGGAIFSGAVSIGTSGTSGSLTVNLNSTGNVAYFGATASTTTNAVNNVGIYNATTISTTAASTTSYGLLNAPTFSTSGSGTYTNAYGAKFQANGSATATTAYTVSISAPAFGTTKVALQTDNTTVSETTTLTGSISDGYAAVTRMSPTYAGAFTVTRHNYMDVNNVLLTGGAAVTDAAVFRFDAAPGTHKAVDSGTTKTSPGTVNAWEKRNVNGTIYYAPLYTSKTS